MHCAEFLFLLRSSFKDTGKNCTLDREEKKKSKNDKLTERGRKTEEYTETD